MVAPATPEKVTETWLRSILDPEIEIIFTERLCTVRTSPPSLYKHLQDPNYLNRVITACVTFTHGAITREDFLITCKALGIPTRL